jgi:hypothetical protein
LCGGYHGHFDVFDFVGGDEGLEEFKGRAIARLRTTNLARAEPRFSTLEPLGLERSHIRHIYPVNPPTATGSIQSMKMDGSGWAE